MDVIKNDDGPGSKLRSFELSAVFILPYDLVSKRKSSKVYDGKCASVAVITAASSSTSASKNPSIQKNGTHLR